MFLCYEHDRQSVWSMSLILELRDIKEKVKVIINTLSASWITGRQWFDSHCSTHRIICAEG